MEYKKEFDRWNRIKKRVNSHNQRPLFCEKEIWWCSFGVNIGSEHDGKGEIFARPVLIKKINKRAFIGIPMTTTLKDDSMHIAFYFNYDLHTLILSQIRVLDSKRLINMVGVISDYLYIKTKKTVSLMLS